MKKSTGIILILLMMIPAGYFAARKYSYSAMYESLEFPEIENTVIEYMTGIADPMDFVPETDLDITVKDNQKIDTSAAGEHEITYIAAGTDIFSQTAVREFKKTFTVKDTKGPEITLAEDHIRSAVNSIPDLSRYVTCSDPADGELPYSETLTEGTWTYEKIDLSKAGEHKLMIRAMDRSGNTASRPLYIDAAGDPESVSFYIRVNRAANTVTVYDRNEDGTAGDPLKVMVCSTGDATPLGSYPTFAKYEWRALFGGVFGQYATAITGNILFHSVPYFSMNKGDLEYLEYNKLGTAASMGCVRLSVTDAKWIYENCVLGTTVEFYDDEDNPGPLGKPVPIEIDVSSSSRGWDPTDPDPANPWKNKKG
ncbi:MAG: L,D-transpeptidase family protein [Solobacterium sp.]|nr:L,D-transpeptidase family protein [Solobacterium sp.]